MLSLPASASSAIWSLCMPARRIVLVTLLVTENGCCCRAAMIGFVLAVVAFSKTGKNIYQQIGSWPQPVFAVFALIAVGTLVPILRYA